MVINMTKFPIMCWSDDQILAAKKLATDGVIRGYELPTILPQDPCDEVVAMAWQTRHRLDTTFDNIDAVIVQGEPVFVYNFVDACSGGYPDIVCYSPCYDSDGKFVQFRRF